VVKIVSESFERAVRDLEEAASESLDLRGAASTQPRHFRRFVQLLGAAPPGGPVRSVTFDGVDFSETNDEGGGVVRIRELDWEELFGSTLPRHPILQKIERRVRALAYTYCTRNTKRRRKNNGWIANSCIYIRDGLEDLESARSYL
jgi:hypothetical protein